MRTAARPEAGRRRRPELGLITRIATAGAAALLLAAKAPEPRQLIALADVTVVDVESGRVEPHRTVLVDGGRISAIGAAGKVPIPLGSDVLAGAGKFLIPGLWDMHVHTGDPSYLNLLVANGVTGVRDMGGSASGANDGCESIAPKQLLAWRREVTGGSRIGPRLVLSGPVASGVEKGTGLPVRTAKEAGRAVKDLRDLGVDLVAVDGSLPSEAYQALATEALAAGLPFAGELPPGGASLLTAIEAGQRSVEHVREPLLPCFTPDREELQRFFRDAAWTPADLDWGARLHADCPAAIAALARGETWLTPTLVVERANVRVDDSEYLKDPHRGLLPTSVRQGFNAFVARMRSQPEEGRRRDRVRWEAQQRLVRRMQGAGVHLLAGSDAPCNGGVPGFSLHDELDALVEAGLSPLEALRSATWNPAAYLGQTAQLGSIAVGKRADLVLLGANPLLAIRHTRDIEAVVLDGRLLRRSALDGLLASVIPETPDHP